MSLALASPEPFLQCRVCRNGTTIEASVSEGWVCPVCKSGSHPDKERCLACGLSRGIFLPVESDHGRWLHLLCARMLKVTVKRFEEPTENLVDSLFTRYQLKSVKNLKSNKCWVCSGNYSSASVRCKSCKKFVHIRCVVNSEIEFQDEELICPCKTAAVKIQKKKFLKKKPSDASLPVVRVTPN